MTLRLELARIRARGYALDHEEIILGVHCIAVPILNFAGHAVGAISIAGTSTKVEGDRLAVLAERMTAAGEHLSRRIGFVHTAQNGAD